MRFASQVSIANGVAQPDPVATPAGVPNNLIATLPERVDPGAGDTCRRLLLGLSAPAAESVTIELWALLEPPRRAGRPQDIVEDPSARVFFLLATGNAAAAQLLGVGGTFPTGFIGGETLNVTVDGTAIAVVFTAGASTALQVAAEINATAIAAGLTFQPASVSLAGQLVLTGQVTGPTGAVAVTGGTGAATVGFPATPSAVGTSDNLTVSGAVLAEVTATVPTGGKIYVRRVSDTLTAPRSLGLTCAA